jgi:putative oxidoreductase
MREGALVESGDLGLLVIRLVFGLFLAAHGLNKIRGKAGLDGTAGWFGSIGMKWPRLQARLAAGTEIVAGVLFAAGLLTSFAAAAMVSLMVVAWFVAHRTTGFFIFNAGQGWEYVASIAAAAFALGATGAGKASLDHALGWHLEGWWGAVVAGFVGVGGAVVHLGTSYRPVVTTS